MGNKYIVKMVKRYNILTEKMTVADRRAFALGRAEFARGEYATLEELNDDLEARRLEEGTKKPRSVSR